MAEQSAQTQTARPPREMRGSKKVSVAPLVTSSARLLNAASVCAFLDVSMDTLDRLTGDVDEAFPEAIRLGSSGRDRYWTLGSIEAYVRRKVEKAERETPK